jgi:hypothetical protein
MVYVSLKDRSVIKTEFLFEGKAVDTKVHHIDHDGGQYKGQIANNKPFGKGTLICKKQTKSENTGSMGNVDYHYEGEWEYGEKHGQGTLINKTENYTYKGEFQHNKMTGKGELETSKGVYKGNFEDRQLSSESEGTFVSKDGTEKYTGNWRNGKYHGSGKLTKDNDVYEGNFYQGHKENHGTMTYHNGDVYEGNWDTGVKTGYGTLTSANGDVYSGEFRRDQFNG